MYSLTIWGWGFSFLLGLSAPYAIYTSEALSGWMRAAPWRRRTLGAALLLLCAASAATFSYQAVFRKADLPGTEWRSGQP